MARHRSPGGATSPALEEALQRAGRIAGPKRVRRPSGTKPAPAGKAAVAAVAAGALIVIGYQGASAAGSTDSSAAEANLFKARYAAPPKAVEMLPNLAQSDPSAELTKLSLGLRAQDERSAAENQARTAAEEAAKKAVKAAEDVRKAAEDKKSSVRGAFAKPAEGRLTSGFGARWGGSHRGIDIANAIGTPIRAAAAGVVIDAGPASGFGLWVRVQHADGTITTYGHMDKILTRLGAQVKAGDQIATIGNRGQSTGPHLHFEVQLPGGRDVDPKAWLAQRGIFV
ncbi:M23 family metallopeptidase [Allokutzneria sp. A3M-2-11 16]|uniref:M23 family metallopeptidase n=1 Tax=Allokutzneria sp. A3M-2-11 16 TaxID=2962043 RepID=UPI0020B6DF85|nr:peptidoglycan DD-metalloendopeptidase family protein [Allokutzneria sp. A3M-2-11 16]MCP3801562.1 M23 family metallopeptidase [Allokutzneria sp. A3M-2-11 16]